MFQDNFITLLRVREARGKTFSYMFFFLICYYGNANTAKIQAYPTFVFSDLPNISHLVFFVVTRFLGRSLFLAASQLGPVSLLLKKAAKPPEWVVEVKENQQKVSDFSLLLSRSTYIGYPALLQGPVFSAFIYNLYSNVIECNIK